MRCIVCELLRRAIAPIGHISEIVLPEFACDGAVVAPEDFMKIPWKPDYSPMSFPMPAQMQPTLAVRGKD